MVPKLTPPTKTQLFEKLDGVCSGVVSPDCLSAAQRGENEAIKQLFTSFEAPIYRFTLRLLGRIEDAEDATQECFYKAIKALPRYSDQGRFRAWLYQIARNEAMAILRKRKRDAAPDLVVLEHFEDLQAPVDRDVEHQEHLSLLRDHLQTLPGLEREVVDLRLSRDITFREIADLTGNPINTVLSRMRSATLRLKKLMIPQ